MRNEPRLGIMLMIAVTLIFAMQDGFSRHLAGEYNTLLVVMFRYWFFAAFVCALAIRQHGSIRRAAATRQPLLQITRGLLLAGEICVAVWGFTLIGLVQSHAVFTSYPLLIAALSGPVLGEKVGWRRWAAIGVGFIGVLIILNPGSGVFTPLAIIPLVSSLMFAMYGLLTRYAARADNTATSFFWTGVAGAVFMTPLGLWNWEWMTPRDALFMLALCLSGALGHWMLIKCYEVTEASTVQPFAYFQLIFASLIGMLVFGESLQWNLAVGATVVVGAGLFTLWRERVAQRRSRA
jgi:drug/metabolite transporter (DMT)-like permease